MWRDQGAREEIVELVPGTCLTIPVGTRFQSQSDDQNLEAVAVTMPPWPGGGGPSWSTGSGQRWWDRFIALCRVYRPLHLS